MSRAETSLEANVPFDFSLPEEPGPGWHELQAVSEELEDAPAEKIVRWALDTFGDDLVVACSFQDSVLVDLATKVEPEIEFLFLDTGFHFPETLAYVERVRRRYGLKLRVVTPGPEADGWPCGSERCCELRKVAPLRRALAGRQAWMTGLRRADSVERADTKVVAKDLNTGLIKISPLVAWSDEDVADYVLENDLAVHPLSEEGYASIGCAPTTLPVEPGQHARAGRWPGQEKTECGLHI